MTDLQQHWDRIYRTKAQTQLGWYEASLNQSRRFLALTGLSAGSRVFIPGAGTSDLVTALHQQGCQLILNDVSSQALNQLAEKLQAISGVADGSNTMAPVFLQQDISKPLDATNAPLASANTGTNISLNLSADIWIDRAVLHFLLDETQIDTYFANLKKVLQPGGYALFAQFAEGGATQCAGLPVQQYSIAKLSEKLGRRFTLVAHEDFTFVNPSGAKRPYVYGLFQLTAP